MTIMRNRFIYIDNMKDLFDIAVFELSQYQDDKEEQERILKEMKEHAIKMGVSYGKISKTTTDK